MKSSLHLARAVWTLAACLIGTVVASASAAQQGEAGPIHGETSEAEHAAEVRRTMPTSAIARTQRTIHAIDWLRDPYILAATDGAYYLTGTLRDTKIGDCWAWNAGVPLWRSTDLKHWEDHGLIWSFERDATWDAEIRPVPEDHWEFNRISDRSERLPPIRRAAWAPEIHQIGAECYLTYTLNWVPGYRTVLLRSRTGRPEGPYEHVRQEPMSQQIDSTLFRDTTGIYYLWQGGQCALLLPDASGFAEEPWRLRQKQWQPEPYLEGSSVIEHEAHVYLFLAAWSYRDPTTGHITYAPTDDVHRTHRKWSYDSVVARADGLRGQFTERRAFLMGGGHGHLFRDHTGEWWSTVFVNPRGDYSDKASSCQPALVPIDWRDGWPTPPDELNRRSLKRA